MKRRSRILIMLCLAVSLALPVTIYAQDSSAQPAATPAAAEIAAGTIDITPGATDAGKGQMYSIELRDTSLVDLFRFLAHEYKLNLLVSDNVQGKITATFTNVSLEEALEEIADSQGLAIEKKNNFIRISSNVITKVIPLQFTEASALLGSGVEGSKTSSIFDLLSEKGKILLGNAPNSIVVVDFPVNVQKVEDYVKAIDQRMSKRVFKIKYLKASDLMGANNTTQAQ